MHNTVHMCVVTRGVCLGFVSLQGPWFFYLCEGGVFILFITFVITILLLKQGLTVWPWLEGRVFLVSAVLCPSG